MNLQRVGQRVGLRCVNDDHQGVPHGPSLTEKIQSSARSEELFSGASSVLGIPPFVSLYSPFYSRFPPPNRGPQGRYLSHQPLPSVVGSGCKDREVWLCQAKSTECNKGSLPLDASVLSVISLYFSAFPALWNDLESYYQWSVTSFTLGYIHPRRIFLWPRRGFSMDQAPGPVQILKQAYQSFTPHNSPSKSCCSAPRMNRRILVTSGLYHGLPIMPESLHLLEARPWL